MAFTAGEIGGTGVTRNLLTAIIRPSSTATCVSCEELRQFCHNYVYKRVSDLCTISSSVKVGADFHMLHEDIKIVHTHNMYIDTRLMDNELPFIVLFSFY